MLKTIEPTAVNANGTQYTTTDNLGSPRVITNSSGSVVSRHDYLPFGEEIGAGTGDRTTAMGFSGNGDDNRKKFTGYERDSETGLDFAQARYYSNTQGRLTTVDPLLASAHPVNPQSWNRYSYVLNNPLRLVDPSGMDPDDIMEFVEDEEQWEQEPSTKPQQPPPPPLPPGLEYVDVGSWPSAADIKGPMVSATVTVTAGQEVPITTNETPVATSVQMRPQQAESYTNTTLSGGPLSAGLLVDSNSQVYASLGIGIGWPDVGFTNTEGKGPVETGLFLNGTVANGLAVSESVNILQPANGPSREVGIGNPQANAGIQIVVGPFEGTTPRDWLYHPDNPEGKGPLWHVGRSPY